jgi:hypothetical protein
MSYIGQGPQFASFPSKFFDGDGSAMTVTLDYAPPNLAALLVFIDGVRQDTSAYTLSGTSLTFTGSVPSGTANVQVVHLGLQVDVGVPGDDTITSAKIVDGAIVNADINASAAIDATKIADGTVTSTEFQYINSLSSNAQTQITARLPLAGGTMSGETIFADQLVTRPQMKDYSETVAAAGTKTAAFNLDLESGNVQTLTMSGGGTFNIGITNALSSHSNSITILGTNLGSVTATFYAGAHDGGGNKVYWADGDDTSNNLMSSSGTDVVSFTTFDGGTNFYGFVAGKGMTNS